MSRRSIRPLTLLAVTLLASACRESSPTAPAEPDLELQAAITVAGAEAARSGDAERAEALSHGASALRWGIRPSTIEVKVKNETYTYLAIVIGVVRHRGTERVLVRSLVAWTGRRPTALLQVISASDEALFGHPGNGNGNGSGNGGPDGARGQWKDLSNHELWVATAGSANVELQDTGDACPVQPPGRALRCLLASYDLRINGNFQLVGADGPNGTPIEIHTSADGVHGVVIKPAH
jgi:hypothetical protein